MAAGRNSNPNPNPPEPQLPMPEAFKNRIQEIAESEGKNIDEQSVVFVMEKQLSPSDVESAQHRLFIAPLKNKFLTADEDIFLKQFQGKNKNSKPVWIIDPDRDKSSVTLKRWRTGTSPDRLAYVFCNEWKRIVKKNNLQNTDGVRLWAVRVGLDRELWFALDKLPTNDPPPPRARGNLLNRSSIMEQKRDSDEKNSDIELEAKMKKNTEIELEVNTKKNSEIELEADMKKNSEIELEVDIKMKNSEIELEAKMKKNSEIELETKMKKNSEIELEANMKKKNSDIELEDKTENSRIQRGPELPIEVVNKIKEIERGEVDQSKILVIRKPLSSYDLNKSDDCFFIPPAEMLNGDFLNRDERVLLLTEQLPHLCVELIDTKLESHSVRLIPWYKPGFVVTKGWNFVVSSNKLEKGQILELWALRVEKRLWFVLRDVTRK
ncbi:hypothetical protein ACH5RR_007505 [Cinchona calisaya]|uniref:B3 domain-containing protein n=1 Tax=Cinchona calisaya TaxID=153742 RepID=A0ABD3ARY8_9GENT